MTSIKVISKNNLLCVIFYIVCSQKQKFKNKSYIFVIDIVKAKLNFKKNPNC